MVLSWKNHLFSWGRANSSHSQLSLTCPSAEGPAKAAAAFSNSPRKRSTPAHTLFRKPVPQNSTNNLRDSVLLIPQITFSFCPQEPQTVFVPQSPVQYRLSACLTPFLTCYLEQIRLLYINGAKFACWWQARKAWPVLTLCEWSLVLGVSLFSV